MNGRGSSANELRENSAGGSGYRAEPQPDDNQKKKFTTGGNVWDSVTDAPALTNGSGGSSVAPDAVEAEPASTSHSPDGGAAPAESDTTEQDRDSVNVVVRVRPLNRQEVERKDSLAVQFPGNGILWCENNGSLKPFAFNVLFEPEASQYDIFEHSGVKKLVSMATEGFACTCFAFGQTGSGKTHTITGPPQQLQNGKTLQESDYGLIQRSFVYLCELVDKQRKSGVTCVITASYFELYNEQVIDLLNVRSGRKLNVRWSKDKGFHVENVFTVQCENLSDLMSVLDEGLQNRSMTAHNMNELSSRSHSMLVLSIESEMPDPEDENLFLTKQGKLTFVDLAGSEKVKDTSTSGSQLLETNNINRSLLVLGKCISALGNPKKRLGHIPYRDSKLTKLLADSIGGNGVTLMVACVSPSSSNVAETLNTLRYAIRAKRIRNQPVVRMDPREKLIMGMKKEIHLLRMENEYLREQLQFPRSSPKATKASPSVGAGGPSSSAASSKSSPRSDVGGGLAPTAGRGQVKAAGLTLPDRGYAAEDSRRREREERQASAEQPTIAASVAAAIAAATADTPQVHDDNQKDLYDMLKEYMVENEALRTQNAEMHQQGGRLQHDQEVLFRENDRLRRKIEDIERFLISGGDNRVFMYGVGGYPAGGYPAGGWPWYGEAPPYISHSGLSSASSQASRYTHTSSRSEAYGPGTPYTVPTSPVVGQVYGQGPRAGPPTHGPGQRHRQRAYRLVHLAPPAQANLSPQQSLQQQQQQPSPQLQYQQQQALLTLNDGPLQSGSGSGKPPLPSVSQGTSYSNVLSRSGSQQKQKQAPSKETTPPLRVVYGGDEEQHRYGELSQNEPSPCRPPASNDAAGLRYVPNKSESDLDDRTPKYNEVNERLRKELLELDSEIRSTQKAIQNSG